MNIHMKMKLFTLAGSMAVLLFAAGCGKQKTAVEITPTPVPEPVLTATPSPTPVPKSDLVDMQVTAGSAKESQEKADHEVGTNTEGMGSYIVENRTGSNIAEFFMRLHPTGDVDEDEWGTERISSAFVFANGETMRVYFQPGNDQTMYDLRVSYTDEDLSDCFFRSLPLGTISKVVLRMEGSGEDSIPYVTYLAKGNRKEYSTLNDVRRRLGLLENDLDNVSDEDDVMQSDGEPSGQRSQTQSEEQDQEQDHGSDSGSQQESAQEAAQEQQQEEEPSAGEIDTGEIVGDSEAVTGTMATAGNYIGQSLGALQSAVGAANASDYEDVPGLGMTGYHYYGSFTVSTTVDDDGNEIVTGVW